MASAHSFDDDQAPPRPAVGWSAPALVVAVLGAALAVVLAGAVLLQLAGSDLAVRTSPVFASLLAGTVGLLAVVALPLWWERHARRRWHLTDPLLRRPRVSWVLPWSLFMLLAPALLAPDLCRAALTNHGAWMVRGGPDGVVRAVERAARATAYAIPLRSPIALTHRSVWPWVDRNSPECTGAPAAAR